ncbi:MAG: ATP-binding protein [Oscillospiraceae bacterium]|nr:ATP-binding protein [Oscillospiraceae bacterium]
MANMVLMCGHIASGKSWFAKRFAEKHGYRYLDIDACYQIYNGDEKIHENKFEVWILFYQLIHQAAMLKHDTVVDTNAPLMSYRDEFLSWFPEFDQHHLIWIDADPELAWTNNLGRERSVPRETFDHLIANFQEPTADEGVTVCRSAWDSICRIKNRNNELQPPEFIKGDPWDCSI